MEKGYYLPFFMNLLQYNSFYYIATLQKFSYQVWMQNTHLNIQLKEAKSKLEDIKKDTVRRALQILEKKIQKQIQQWNLPPSSIFYYYFYKLDGKL
jgi:hypothetical protein